MPDSIKRKKFLALLSTCILVLVFVSMSLFCHSGKQQLNQRLQELRDQGYPTKLSDLEDIPTTPYDTNNASLLYVDALTHFTSGSIDLAQLERNLPMAAQALDDPNQKLIQETLTDHEDILVLLHQAAKMEHCYHPIDYTTGEFSPRIPLLSTTKLIRLLSLETFNYSEQNNPTAAYESIEAGIELTNFFDNPINLIYYMLRNLGQNHIIRSLQRVFNRVPLSEQQLEHLSVTLEDWLITNGLAQAFAAERCQMLHGMQQAPKHSKIMYLWSGLGLLDRDKLHYIDLMQVEIDITHLPYHQQLAAAQQHSESFKKFHSPFLRGFNHRQLNNFLKHHLNTIAQIHLAHTAIAIERYKLAVGIQPDTLEDLIPQYITTIPQDPITGVSLRYQSSEKGYRLFYPDTNSTSSIKRDSQDLSFAVSRL